MRAIGQLEELRLWLSCGTEQFVRQSAAVRARFPDLYEAFALAQRKNMSAFGFLPEIAAQKLVEAAQDGFVARFIERLIKGNIDFVLDDDDAYPALLSEIHDPPAVLYIKGRLPVDSALSIAVVGTRGPTEYGRDVAKMVSHALCKAGAVIVSGMAGGIDSCAARGALDISDAVCPTVAVLGTGVDVVYPAENRALYAEIVSRGAVVSEFLPGTPARSTHFPIRNRVISGLARGVLVVEAGERSGTTITAGYAHEQGREVFAIPGRITDAKSVGTNRLIRDGEAKAVFGADDILCEFGAAEAGGAIRVQRVDLTALTEPQRRVVRLLQAGERTIDELTEETSLPIGELNSLLTELHFSGIIKQLPGRVYALDTARAVVG